MLQRSMNRSFFLERDCAGWTENDSGATSVASSDRSGLETMERFLRKIQELEREAQALVERESWRRSPRRSPRRSATPSDQSELVEDGDQSPKVVALSHYHK